MIKFLFALVLLPSVLVVALGAVKVAAGAFFHPEITLPFLTGALAYLLIHCLGFRPARTYVLAHELGHAMAALLSGVGVRGISVGKRGGYVSLSGSSAFISLAPYCIPFYALAAVIIYVAAGWIWDIKGYRPYFTGVMGFLLAFHIVCTAGTLIEHTQSDLKKAGGVFFSLLFIVFINSVVILVSLKFLFPEIVQVKAFVSDVFHKTAGFWKAVFDFLVYAAREMIYVSRRTIQAN